MRGGAGADELRGGVKADELFGDEGDDLLIVESGADILQGGVGDDRFSVFLNTGVESVAGARLDGGAGLSDTATFFSTPGITVDLNAGTAVGGFGTLFLTNIENINVQGEAGATYRVIGNAGNNVLQARTPLTPDASIKMIFDGGVGDDVVAGDLLGADQLRGGVGDDKVSGLGGDDILAGDAGNDSLDGGVGTDRMVGGAGDYQYVIDAVGDVAIEAVGGGVDTVSSSVAFNMNGQEIENLILTGATPINAVGNILNNIMVGNEASNALSGGVGADIMRGLGGSDVYTVDNTFDQVIELSDNGIDLVRSGVTLTLGANVEKLTLLTNAQINGVGNALDNTIVGNARPNVIIGLAGRDLMTGGEGADRFDFRAVSDSSAAAFDGAADMRIVLEGDHSDYDNFRL